MSNDAKGCYDCIAHVVVDLALRRLGIPKPALQSMIEAIQNMEHHMRTALGDSEEHYGNDGGPPPQGLLQGNGAGPAGWYSIAHLMIKILQGMGFGYNAITPIFQRAFQVTCFAFVDDTDIVHATTDPEKPSEDLIQEAQTALTNGRISYVPQEGLSHQRKAIGTSSTSYKKGENGYMQALWTTTSHYNWIMDM